MPAVWVGPGSKILRHFGRRSSYGVELKLAWVFPGRVPWTVEWLRRCAHTARHQSLMVFIGTYPLSRTTDCPSGDSSQFSNFMAALSAGWSAR
jgi:hypothetical protein